MNGEYICQILTDDCFTLIENLTDTPGQGFRIRVWKRNVATITSSGGYYVTTEFKTKTPLNDVTFKRPDDPTGDDTLIYIQTENTGSSPRTITNEIFQTLDDFGRPATVTSKVFKDTAITGSGATQLTQEDLIYSASTHGTRPWDYKIARTVKTATLAADGSNGNFASTAVTTAVTAEEYWDFSISDAGGELGMKRLVSYSSSGQTTSYTYMSDLADPTVNGRLQSVVYPNGSWKSYEYSISAVSVITEYSSWQDVPTTDFASTHTTAARKTVTLVDDKYSSVETYIDGHLIAKSETTLTSSDENLIITRQWDGTGDGATLGDSNSLTSTTAYYGEADTTYPGRIKRIEHQDGTVTTYGYTAITVVETTPLTVTTTTYGPRQLPIGQETKTIAGTTIGHWYTDGENTDNLGRPIKRIQLYVDKPGNLDDYDISTYTCCGLATFRARDGSYTTYDRDYLKRGYKMTTKATPDSPTITTTTAYKTTTGSGLATRVERGGVFVSETTQSLDGLTTTTVSASRKSTDTGDRLITRTRPDVDVVTTTIEEYSVAATPTVWTTTSQTTHYLDGSPHAVTGAAVTPVTYTYAVNTDVGGLVASSSTPTSGSTAEITKTYTDALGRTVKSVSPANHTTNYEYYATSFAAGSRGKLKSVADADCAVDETSITYAYNEKGERITSTRKVPNGTETPGDLVTTTTDDVVASISINVFGLGVSYHRNEELGDGTSTITLSDSYKSTDGLSSGSVTPTGGTVTYRTSPSSTTVTTILPDGTKTIQTTAPDTTGDSTQTAHYASGSATPISSTTYLYDTLQRLLSVTDSRTGATTYTGYTESGTALTTTQGTRATTIENDVLGRTVKVDAPDTPNPADPETPYANITFTSYYPTGQVKAVWGDQTYPVLRVYNGQGQLTTLYTYQALTGEPVNATGAAATTWTYSPTTGQLLSKQDATLNGPSYTYTPAGRLKTRTWARGVHTRYDYLYGFPVATRYFTITTADTGTNVGNDTDTPDVNTTFDFLGRQLAITQTAIKTVGDVTTHPVQSQIEYGYADGTEGDHAISSETTSYDFDLDGSFDLTRVLDRADRSFGRDMGFTLGTADNHDQSVSYGYNNAGSVNGVTGAGKVFTYGYAYTQDPDASAPRVGVAATGAINDFKPYALAAPEHTVIRTYEATRDVLVSIDNKIGTSVSYYLYGVNNLGQRENLNTTGPAFSDSDHNWAWHYDALGQLTTATCGWDSTLSRTYTFDDIGNRLTAAADDHDGRGFSTTTYTPNSLNQYASINPGTAVTPTYDDDGNLYADATIHANGFGRKFKWDGENRLTAVCKDDEGSTLLASYAYDPIGRRIRKTIAPGVSDTAYVYDGWNVVAEYAISGSSATLTQAYTWGLDISGSLQGAGGVGGLLCIHRGPGTADGIRTWTDAFYPTFDGNGNVSEYLDKEGVQVAHFEYDPFGQVVYSTGSPGLFTYRFSTKPQDYETGFYYYGYRYYDPLTGRWPSRDPMGEEGGEDLYGFVGNDGVNALDMLGRANTREGHYNEPALLFEYDERTSKFKYIDSLSTDTVCTYQIFAKDEHIKVTGVFRIIYNTDNAENVVKAVFDKVFESIGKKALPKQAVLPLTVVIAGFKEAENDGLSIPDNINIIDRVPQLTDTHVHRDVIKDWRTGALVNTDRTPSLPGEPRCPCEKIPDKVVVSNKKEYRPTDPNDPDAPNNPRNRNKK